MPRARRNDPAGVSDSPNVVTDPVRVAEGVERFKRGLACIEESYRLEKRLGLDKAGYNESLYRLRRAVGRPRKPGAPETRLNFWLELAINIRARELVGIHSLEPLGDEHWHFVQQAAHEIAKKAKILRGAPGNSILRRHIEALIALVQKTSGRPVLGRRYKGINHYDPQLLGPCGNTIRIIAEHLEPGMSETTLVNLVNDARDKFAAKPMPFRRYFPFFDVPIDTRSGLPTVPSAEEVKLEVIIQPIYCP